MWGDLQPRQFIIYSLRCRLSCSIHFESSQYTPCNLCIMLATFFNRLWMSNRFVRKSRHISPKLDMFLKLLDPVILKGLSILCCSGDMHMRDWFPMRHVYTNLPAQTSPLSATFFQFISMTFVGILST